MRLRTAYDVPSTARGVGVSADDERVLAGSHDLADHRVAGHLADHQQAAGGLGVGQQQQLVLVDATASRCGRTQSRLRRVPPLT